MKITAEFNSNEELISFIDTFGANALKGVQAPAVVKKEETKKVEQPKKEIKKEEIKKVDPPKEEDKKETPVEQPKKEVKITKETIRAAFAKLIKAGKADKAKEITAKFGAKKVPDLKEEDYEAVLKEVEELL